MTSCERETCIAWYLTPYSPFIDVSVIDDLQPLDLHVPELHGVAVAAKPKCRPAILARVGVALGTRDLAHVAVEDHRAV